MKSNRKFIETKAGVSAVIGVILMVAITVAIAGTVYIYISQMISVPSNDLHTPLFIEVTYEEVNFTGILYGFYEDEYNVDPIFIGNHTLEPVFIRYADERYLYHLIGYDITLILICVNYDAEFHHYTYIGAYINK